MITKRHFLVCFVGMDGTGKTTQTKRLVSALNARGINSKYVWNTYQPFLLKPFIALGQALFLRKKDAFKDYSGYSQSKHGIFKNRFLSWSYQHLLLLDYWLQSVVSIMVPLILGKTVVSDRYVYDVVANLAVDMGYSEEIIRKRVRRLLLLLPKPDLVFFLDAPEEISFQRKSDIASIEHLKNRRKIYLDMAKDARAVVVDGSKTPDEVESIVHGELKQAGVNIL